MVTPRTFAQALLGALELPVTSNNVAALVAWQAAEGGHFVNPKAAYNPLNTTRELPGSSLAYTLWRDSQGTPHGFQAYQSWDQGLEATSKTLAQQAFSTIRVRLGQDAAPAVTLAAVKDTPWGTFNLQPEAWRAYQPYGDRTDPGEFSAYQVASVTTSRDLGEAEATGVIATIKQHPWLALAGAGLILGVAGALAYHFKSAAHGSRLLALGAGEAGKSSVVQSLLFPRSSYTKQTAALWARSHGFRADKIDVTARHIRIRQRSPSSLERMRTIHMGPEIKAVVGWPSRRSA